MLRILLNRSLISFMCTSGGDYEAHVQYWMFANRMGGVQTSAIFKRWTSSQFMTL